MLKALIAVIFLFSSIESLVAGTVRLNDVDTPVVQLVTSTTFSLIVDSPSGDGTSETAPAKTYVPIRSNDGTNSSQDYSTFGASAASLPISTNTTDVNDWVSDPKLRFFLDTTSVTNGHFLHAAIKDGGSTDYEVVSSILVTGDEDNKQFDVDFETMCAVNSAELDCTKILNDDPPSEVQSPNMYFYIHSSQDGIGDPIDPASRANGVYYQVNVSNKVYSSNTISMTELIKGDGRLTAVYQGFTVNNILRVAGFSHTGSCPAADLTFSAATGTAFPFDDKVATSGELIIRPLTNDTAYFFSVYFEDKFKFATKLSDCIAGTPQEIEALLKKNSCFLLTAGFNGDHRIIDYFRKWRDQTLAKTSLGKKFINFYYQWGPKAAPVVLSNPWLAKTVRGGAHVAYWFIEYRIWLVMLVFAFALALGTMMFALNRKEGDLLPWQVTASSPISSTEKAHKTQNAERSFPNS